MISLLSSLKNQSVILAVSGGPDSMAALHYIQKRYSTNIVAVVNFIHNDPFSYSAFDLVSNYCSINNIKLISSHSTNTFNSNKEHNWRNERYNFFSLVSDSFNNKYPIVTAHNLDDALETYLMSFIKAGPSHTKLIPPSRSNPFLIRPFLITKKDTLLQYCIYNNIPYLLDPCNTDMSLLRSKIRHKIKPLTLEVNPGLYKQIISMYKSLLIQNPLLLSNHT